MVAVMIAAVQDFDYCCAVRGPESPKKMATPSVPVRPSALVGCPVALSPT